MRIEVLFAEHVEQLGYSKSTPACGAESAAPQLADR